MWLVWLTVSSMLVGRGRSASLPRTRKTGSLLWSSTCRFQKKDGEAVPIRLEAIASRLEAIAFSDWSVTSTEPWMVRPQGYCMHNESLPLDVMYLSLHLASRRLLQVPNEMLALHQQIEPHPASLISANRTRPQEFQTSWDLIRLISLNLAIVLFITKNIKYQAYLYRYLFNI